MTEQTPREALDALLEDLVYPACGGSGEYEECWQAEEVSAGLLRALWGTIELVEAYRLDRGRWPRGELADRLENVLREHLEFEEV